MARARSRVRQAPPGDDAARAAVTPHGPTARPRPDVRTASVAPEAMRALQQAAGNTAARRVKTTSAPKAPQRLWTNKEFTERTYESFFTAKSAAQTAVIEMLTSYYALPTEKKKPTAAHANMLAQMKAAAQLWIDDHTVALDDGTTSEDPNRVKRMQGFKDFITNVDAELALVKGVLGDKYSEEIGEEHQAYKKLRDHYKGSADSLFVKAAGVLDKAVSAPGDSASVEVEFEIPIDPSGVGFIGGRLSIEAEKDDDGMIKARTEMVVTGGANIGVAKVKAELGGYIEAQAATSADVMNLYSYGLYRRFRESKAIPREVANYMWGGQTSQHGYDKAEVWSRDLEKRLFSEIPDVDPDDPKYKSMPPSKAKAAIAADQAAVEKARERVKNTYIETGGVVAGKGEIGISDLVEMEIGVTYTAGKKITAESIKAAKGSAGAKNSGGLTGRGAQKSLGEDTSSVSFSASVTVGSFEVAFEVAKSGSDLEITFDAEGTIPGDLLGGAPAWLADIGVALVKFVRATKASQESDSLGPVIAFGSLQKAMYGPIIAGALSGEGPQVGSVGLGVSMSAEREDGEWSGSIEIKHVQKLSFEPPIGLKVELAKSSRLGALEYSGGQWSLK